MANIIPFDSDAIQQVLLQLPAPPGSGGAPYAIDFQFPPIITSDSKGGNWKELSAIFAEPLVMYQGGKPRDISLKWSYIVTNQLGWDIDYITQQVKTLRQYFYSPVSSALIINFRAYDVVGDRNNPSGWTFRAENADISHSDCLVRDPTYSDSFYPLRTDITLSLKFFTTLAQQQAAQSALGADGEAAIKLNGLKQLPTNIAWF